MSKETKQTDDVKWQVPMQRNKHGLWKYYLEGEIKDKFFELYPTTSNKENGKDIRNIHRHSSEVREKIPTEERHGNNRRNAH